MADQQVYNQENKWIAVVVIVVVIIIIIIIIVAVVRNNNNNNNSGGSSSGDPPKSKGGAKNKVDELDPVQDPLKVYVEDVAKGSKQRPLSQLTEKTLEDVTTDSDVRPISPKRDESSTTGSTIRSDFSQESTRKRSIKPVPINSELGNDGSFDSQSSNFSSQTDESPRRLTMRDLLKDNA